MTRLPIGARLYIRHFQRDVLCGLYAAQVLRHDDDGLLAWTPQGSHHWFPFLPDGREMRAAPLPEWHAGPWVWRPWVAPRSVLRWYPPQAPYALEAWFEGGRLHNYYGNVGGPAAAWRDGEAHGVDTEDWDLDVWIDPDLAWSYKDEDDLRGRSRWPDLYWVDDLDRVYDVARQITALVEARSFPFDGTWLNAAPDPAPPAIVEAALSPGWDRPRRR